MVKTAEFPHFDDRAMFADLAFERTLFIQRQMRPGSVVIVAGESATRKVGAD